MARRATLVLVLALVAAGGAAAKPSGKVASIVFPVVGPTHYQDDFGDPRPQGRHEGIDILAPRKAIAVAAEAGRIKFWTTSASAGCMLYLHGVSGTTYLYIHLNNDVGNTNDNQGSCVAGTSYAPGLRNGARVAAGQPIGFVGDSGDANGLHPHLHFEVHPQDGAAVDPFPYLKGAQHPLYGAAPGTTVTLALTGTVLASSADALTVRVVRVKVFPDGTESTVSGQPVTVALPSTAVAPSEGLEGKHVVVLSTPFGSTLDAQLGKGLTAARVAVVIGP